MADEEHHDVQFDSADAGASTTYPQQAGTIRKNGFIVIKNRPCKVSCPIPGTLIARVDGHDLLLGLVQASHAVFLDAYRLICTPHSILLQVVDVSTSKTGKHGHAKCHFVGVDIFTGKKYEDLTPSSHNSDVRLLVLDFSLFHDFCLASVRPPSEKILAQSIGIWQGSEGPGMS